MGLWKGTASTKPKSDSKSGALHRGNSSASPGSNRRPENSHRVCLEDLTDMEKQPESGGAGSACKELSISLSFCIELAVPLQL